MSEHLIDHELRAVATGRLSRRGFVRSMAALGLAAPAANMLLLHRGLNAQPAPPPYKPTRRGGGGTLKTMWWQGATLLNPLLSVGVRDQEACRIFYEPLAVWDGEGNLAPVLAEVIPTRQNGGVQADGMAVVWKLKRGVTWHDGRPFTADDCVFTWEYANEPATAAAMAGRYRGTTVTKLDSHTVRIAFAQPTPFWAVAFVGAGMIIPRHVFSAYAGTRSREAPANLKPVGTGPYRFVDFRPGDMVRGELFPNYHMPNRPYFDSIEIKGGGDAVSAARAVVQVAEYDYAWNLQVADDILLRMEQGGKGRVEFTPSGDIDQIMMNHSDPWQEMNGERSHPASRHFAFTERAVRDAMALVVDRKSMQEFIYGRAGVATGNVLNLPRQFRSSHNRMEFDIEMANALLEAAGWRRGADGVRQKAGRRLSLVFQAGANPVRQKLQTVASQGAQKAGIEVEIKAISPTTFFSTDPGNRDALGRFEGDMQMYTIPMYDPDPQHFMSQFLSSEAKSSANKWAGRNVTRWRNTEFDALYAAALTEVDPVKRAAQFIRMNDIVCSERAVIPVINPARVRGTANRLVTRLTGFDLDLAFLQDWYRD